jgi:hypothetical protein
MEKETAMTREEWLVRLNTEHVLPHIRSNGGDTDKPWRVSVGFPHGSRGGRKAIGQCHSAAKSADGYHEIFISPVLGDPVDVAHVLLHEDIHYVIGLQAGHKAGFKRLATACGLVGKMTATIPSDALRATIKEWLAGMPAYPHGALSDTATEKKGSRLLKATCETCGYTVRVTQKWLDIGAPICPTDDHGSMLTDGV